MKTAIFILITLSISGCASIAGQWITHTERYGYRLEDPCIRCGEKWDQLPNQRFEAQELRSQGVVW